MKLKDLLSKITPLPMRVSRNAQGEHTEIHSRYGGGVAICHQKGRSVEYNEANAIYLTHASNVLPELVEQLNTALSVIEECDPDTVRIYAPKIRAALSKAENIKDK